MPIRHHLLMLHPMDPRGNKLGGIETHVRLMLACHPDDFQVTLVGLDEFGDLEVGKAVPLHIQGRMINFLPVTRVPAEVINKAATSVFASTTLRFALGALRHILTVRRCLKGCSFSAEIQRFEFALLPRLLGLKSVLLVHNEGTKKDKMDSLLKKYWFLYRLNEWIALTLADRIFGVNPGIMKRLETLSQRFAAKSALMSVSVDMQGFAAHPFDFEDGTFRICFAGRLDEFKDPPLMFATIARLKESLGKVEFHYVGATDPRRYSEFAPIASVTVLHGIQTSAGVAAVMARCHAGIVTSFFEGLPVYLLEMLASGRPIGAIRLPQYDPLILPRKSGFLIERGPTQSASADELAAGFVALWNDIRGGQYDPFGIRLLVDPYSTANQMKRLFDCHRGLQGRPIDQTTRLFPREPHRGGMA
jgi:glycosyltransferase involved in cell wall biosynthesis